MATPPDVHLLLQSLPRDSVTRVKKLPTYGHLDFVWGENTHADVYADLASFLSNTRSNRPAAE